MSAARIVLRRRGVPRLAHPFCVYGVVRRVSDLGHVLQVAGDLCVGDFVVAEVATDVTIVGGHVDEAVAAEVEEDHLLLAGFLGFERFAYGGGDGVAGFRCGDDALGAGEEHGALEGLGLRDVGATHQPVLEQLRDDDACAVVAQPAGMYIGGVEVVSEGVHGQQGGVAAFVAEVVAELAAGEFGATLGLCSDVFGGPSIEDGVAHEGEGQAAEVGAATETGNDGVGVFAGHFHLLLGFKAYDGLVQRDVAEYGAEGVFAAGGGGGQLDGLTDGGAERAAVVGVLRDEVLAGAGTHGGGAFHRGVEGAHNHGAVGLLLHGVLHLIDGAFQPEHFGGIGQGSTPLPGAGLGGDVGDAFLLAIVALRQGAVHLVRAKRVDALVLEVDMCGGVEGFLQFVGAYQRGGAVTFVFVEYLLGDVNPGVGLVEFLPRALFGENGEQVLGLQGLFGAGVQQVKRFVFHLRLDVVPACGELILGEEETFLFHFVLEKFVDGLWLLIFRNVGVPACSVYRYDFEHSGLVGAESQAVCFVGAPPCRTAVLSVAYEVALAVGGFADGVGVPQFAVWVATETAHLVEVTPGLVANEAVASVGGTLLDGPFLSLRIDGVALGHEFGGCAGRLRGEVGEVPSVHFDEIRAVGDELHGEHVESVLVACRAIGLF